MRRLAGLAVMLVAAACTGPTPDAAAGTAAIVPEVSTPVGDDALDPPDRAAGGPATPDTSGPGTTTTVTTTATVTTITTVTTTTTRPAITTTTAGTPTSTTTAPAGPRTISLAFTGDTLAHSPLWRRAARNAEPTAGYDFRPMLSGLTPLIDAADLAVCHLETPIVPIGEELSTNPFYGVPVEVVEAIAAAGYDRCSTASNHAADRGVAGVDRTVDALEAAGLAQSGMARRADEIEPRVFEVDGVRLSHLSYTFSFNGLSFPEDQQWRSAVIDPERIIADANTARASGAQVVVVSMHWGAEGVHAPTTSQRRIADEITADGAIDLVIGHHAHVVQPIELVNDTWVVFGLGNILSNLPTSARWPAASQDAAVVTVEVTVDEDDEVVVSRPVVHPTWVDKDAGWIVRLVDDELARSDLSAGQRGRLERSRERTAAVLGEFFVDPTSR